MKNKKGITLIETIVAISIMSIVTTGMGLFFANLWENKFDEIYMGRSLLIASQAVDEVIGNIRKSAQADSGAYFLNYGDDFELIFYSDVDNDENMERVRYFIEESQLKMSIAEPEFLGTSPTYPIEYDGGTSTVANLVVNENIEPLFSYYDDSGELLTTPVDSSYVHLIKVSVRINTNPDKISDVVIDSSTSFRNNN